MMKSTDQSTPAVIHGKMFASLFQQQAAEYDALCWQAFNIARWQLDEAIKNRTEDSRLAVILDIDETILDNSPYAVERAQHNADYDPATWAEWSAMAAADTIAGALGFCRYAASHGVELFYISNRLESEIPGTMVNMYRFGFPYLDEKHLLFKSNSSSKEQRRQRVLSDYEVVLFIGDNLSDFNEVFDKNDLLTRKSNVQKYASHFGHRYIILPNTTYGDWESAVYQYRYSYSPMQRDSIIQAILHGYSTP